MTRSSLTALLALALLAGCGADSSADSSIETAREAWLTTKAACGGAYHYTLPHTSSTGAVSTTWVEIADDLPTVRRFSGTALDVNGVQWTETGAEVGTHAGGQPASTMEQLYDICARDVLSLDPRANQILFKADARGVLVDCSFVVKACQADCVSDFRVTDFDCGPLPPAQ